MFNYPIKLDKIFDKLIQNDAKPIIVGGYVRDSLLKIVSDDIDIEVYNIASFEKLEDLLTEFGSVNSVGKSFGVCKLDFKGFHLDFTLPRIDNKVSVGHCGFDIKIDTSLDYKTASSRRDFTINTIGYDIASRSLLDPFDGITDLKNKVLKVVDAKKFAQDPLRVLRAMQFCARFELKADEQLISICKDMCHNHLLEELAQERLFEEFKKLLLKSEKPSIGLEFLKQIDAFEFFYELDLKQRDWDFTLEIVDRCEKNLIIKIASLCYKMPSKHKKSFITKLTNQKQLLKEITNYHHIIDNIVFKKEPLKYHIIKDADIQSIDIFLKALNIEDKKLQKLQPIINGKDLVKLGFKPSKEFSKLLQLIYEMQLLSL